MKNKEVSVVIPTYNMSKYIEKVIQAIMKQNYRPKEIIIVNDGSSDDTKEILHKLMITTKSIRPIDQENKGAVEATNLGIKNAQSEFILLIDADAILEESIWINEVIKEFEDEKVGAVGGQILTANKGNIWAKIMGYDLEYRYNRIKSKYVHHVSTCATMYRKKAFEEVGLFDKSYRYGYDHDMSYRLNNRGYKLIIKKEISVKHFWKETLRGYIKEQYYSAKGILNLINKYPNKKRGNEVAGIREYIQTPLTLISLIFLISSLFYKDLFIIFMLSFGIILVDRFIQAINIFKIKKDLECLFFQPFIHILRNITWSIATITYFLRINR